MRKIVSLSLLLLAVAAAPAASAERTRVRIVVDASAGGSRLVLTHSEQVAFTVSEDADRIEIVYPAAIVADPPRQTVSSPALEGYALEDGNRLILRTGPAYRGYQTFELHNPFRLVVDVEGGRPAAAPALPAPRRDRSKTIVVLDPGHGGVERGAVGPTGLEEKDLTLLLARRLRQVLQQRDPSVNVVLTRDEDRLIGLDERTAIANHNQADLFVSIHLNASPRSAARGAETYFLSSDATDDEARTLAALENRAAGVSDKVRTTDGNRRDLELVLWDLAQNQYLAESSALAESMQRQLNRLTGIRDRGVRQAPFRVLMGATMPAILVEVGFISNPAEEELLRSIDYRERTVLAMATAVREFLDQIRRAAGPGQTGAAGNAAGR